jgi:putative cell wall-binding protein
VVRTEYKKIVQLIQRMAQQLKHYILTVLPKHLHVNIKLYIMKRNRKIFELNKKTVSHLTKNSYRILGGARVSTTRPTAMTHCSWCIPETF